MQTKDKKTLTHTFLELVAVGGVTGIAAGAIVTTFNILVHEGEHISRNVYAYVRANPAFLPLLFLALVCTGLMLGVAVNLSSTIRGCGIPQTEGATRGLVRFKWWRDLIAMFSASLLSIFMGLSIGAEGPSVFIGATAGDGVSSLLRRNEMIRKYQITGGACTGLAVASNAPLTGIAFAFEEAHKRFTPEVFICSFFSVIFGVVTRSLIYGLLGREVQSSFASYQFHELPIYHYSFVILSGIVCALLGVGFLKACLLSRKAFEKIEHKDKRFTYAIRVMVAVLLGGSVSLIATGVMGGGHELIESLGTFGGILQPTTELAFGLSLVWTLLLILILKSFITTVNVGSGIPCGIFIPIIAIGACIGGVLNTLWTGITPNMKPYCDLLVMICMAAFFTTVVRAPITSIIMICEFTGSFAPLLPVIIAVAISYIVGEISRMEGIYEILLEEHEKETGIHERAVREVYTFTVAKNAMAVGRDVRDILWPGNARVTAIERGEEHILPDGDTNIQAGDVLTIVCKTEAHAKIKDELEHILR